MPLKKPVHKSAQAGFSLIEAMIALSLLAIGLLGQMSLQMESIANNQSAYMRSQASFLANDILDRMRSNEWGVENDLYVASGTDLDTDNTHSSPGCIDSVIGCTPTQLALEDKAEWASNVTELMTNGRGVVSVDGSGMYTITITWGKQIKYLSADDSELYNRLVMRTTL